MINLWKKEIKYFILINIRITLQIYKVFPFRIYYENIYFQLEIIEV